MLKFIFYLFFLIPVCFFNNWFMYIYFLFFFFFFFFFSNNLFCYHFLVSYVFGLDSISFMFCCLSIWICILILFSMLSISFFINSFFFLLFINFLIFMLFMLFLVLDFFLFYFFFEGSLIPMIFIIFGWGYQPERLSAGFFLIFYTLVFSLPFLLVIFMINDFFGSFFFFFDFVLHSDLVMFFIVMSFMVKFPLYGLHIWLPSAHVEAPVSGSMILAGVMLKLGGYGFFRMLDYLYYFISYYGFFFVSLSMVGSFYISLFCLIQSDLKMLIAYSSVCHMGLVISGMFSLTSWGILGSLLFMLGHGFVSSGLFFLVGLVYDRLGSRSFFILSGLIYFMPSLSFFWFMFCIMNMSCPPSINLFSEVFLVMGLLSWSNFVFFFFFFFFFFFSACYWMSIFFFTQHGSSSSLLVYVSF
uniref:NADH dehydrogenase subunit 4 n=1 Tax=Euhemisphaerius bistriatus TaxID=3081096 RepID=UPI002E786D37|nr:NADH dehydrogenase subunit 4 [Epyhemisphaerius bistriatus]WQB38525.1 NADH dehydrogenase subunit 4 [Epyhemisphaerius bistriatus]